MRPIGSVPLHSPQWSELSRPPRLRMPPTIGARRAQRSRQTLGKGVPVEVELRALEVREAEAVDLRDDVGAGDQLAARDRRAAADFAQAERSLGATPARRSQNQTGDAEDRSGQPLRTTHMNPDHRLPQLAGHPARRARPRSITHRRGGIGKRGRLLALIAGCGRCRGATPVSWRASGRSCHRAAWRKTSTLSSSAPVRRG